MGLVALEACAQRAWQKSVVGVEKHHELALRRDESGVSGSRKPAIRAPEESDGRLLTKSRHGRCHFVWRAVVNHNDLSWRWVLIEAAAQRLGDEMGLPIAGNDNGDRSAHQKFSPTVPVAFWESSEASPSSSSRWA